MKATTVSPAPVTSRSSPLLAMGIWIGPAPASKKLMIHPRRRSRGEPPAQAPREASRRPAPCRSRPRPAPGGPGRLLDDAQGHLLDCGVGCARSQPQSTRRRCWPKPPPWVPLATMRVLVTVRCRVADDGSQVAAGPGQQFQKLVAVGVSPNRTDRDRRRAQGGEVGDRVRGATGTVLFAIEGEDHHGVLARDPAEVPDEVVVEPEAPTTTTRSPPKKSSGRASRGDAASPRRSRGLRVGPSSPARPQWGPRARSRWTAALMRARWVNAWGKLPSASPEGPTSSA